MQSSSPKNKIKKSVNLIPFIVITVVLLTGVFAVSFFLSDTSRTQTTVKTENETVSMLECTSKIVENPFFQSKTTVAAEHKVKITFKDDLADKISYTYQGKFSSTEIADEASAAMHADYNKYMGKDSEKFSPHFSSINSEVMISLYAEIINIDSKNARLFFVDDNMISNFTKSSQKFFHEYYADKGFTCKYIN